VTDITPTLLLTRSADLVRLGVRWTGAQVRAGADGGLTLEAGDAATLTLIFPPQAIAEQSIDVSGVAAARLSGASLLSLALPAGARIPLSTEGLLAALAAATVVPATSEADSDGTLLELPCGLLFTPQDKLRAECAATPVGTAAGNAGLWQLDLHGKDAPLALRPLAWKNDDPSMPGPLALSAGQRQAIAESGADVAASVTLGALGATFSAELDTADISWAHRATLGRDQQVTVVQRGVLYPLGHRATLTTTTWRSVGGDGFPAALHTDTQIVVTESVRATPRQDFRFANVELLTRKLSSVQRLDEAPRPVPPDLSLPQIQQRDEADQALEQVLADIETYREQIQGGWATLGQAGYPYCGEYIVLLERMEELRGWLDNPSETDDPSGVAAVRAELKEKTARAKAIKPLVDEEVATARAQLNDAQASAKALRQQIGGLNAEIAAIAAAIANVPPLYFWPADAHDKLLRFNVRMATPRGDLMVAMPLIFVHDFVASGDPHLPDFTSLTDPSTIAALKQQWRQRQAGEIDLPGLAFDLVQAAVPEAGDVHEIYKLAIEAANIVDSYAPRIARIDARIASLRALLPDEDKLTSIVYNLGDNADLAPLKPLVPIAIDFLKDADKSGGLVAPKFSADMLSRTLGPAAASALDAAHLPDFAALYRDTRLLGLSLGELIDTARHGVVIPNGPSIVPILEGVRPVGVTMDWKPLPLKAAGIFRPLDKNQPCYLELQARIAACDAATSATIHNFALGLPASNPVVTIGFASMRMLQAQGKPPSVEVNQFSFELGAELKLLAEIQDKVTAFFKANNPGIVVRRLPNGIAAGYAFALPEVAAGVFLMRNLGASVDVEIPFDGEPVTITLGFARPDNPFALAVTIFGGGGYFLIKMARGGVAGIDLSLNFGAFIAVSFAVARGEVHAYGQVRLRSEAGSYLFEASLRLGGSVDVLGVVSVSIELVLLMTYDSDRNLLVGSATLVIEIHILFFSRAVEIDSGEWILAGSDDNAPRRLAAGTDRHALAADAAQAAWHNYWKAFSA
jgi:hypothetical protein